jgi:hypothetical protein
MIRSLQRSLFALIVQTGFESGVTPGISEPSIT